MGTYSLKVVGVSFANENGTSRQDIIRQCRIGDKAQLVREPDNPYSKNGDAVKVLTADGQIGYISNDYSFWVSRLIDEGATIDAYIERIVGNHKHKPSFGVIIQLLTAKEAEKGFRGSRGIIKDPSPLLYVWASLAAVALFALHKILTS